MSPLRDEQESMFWPWVLGIVLLALVVWVAAQLSGDTDDDVPQPSVPVARSAARPAAGAATGRIEGITPAAFVAWVRDSAAALEREDPGEYSQRGLARLSAAALTVARASADSASIAGAERLAAEVGAAESAAPGYTVALHELLGGAADLVESMDRSGDESVARNVEQARRAVAEMDTTAPLGQQRHLIYQYFDFLGEALAGVRAGPSAGS